VPKLPEVNAQGAHAIEQLGKQYTAKRAVVYDGRVVESSQDHRVSCRSPGVDLTVVQKAFGWLDFSARRIFGGSGDLAQREEIIADQAYRSAFLGLLTILAARNNHTAMALRDRVLASI
jgi:hypothetical protein